MAAQYTAGSFTKNFSWNQSYRRLHSAVAKGFSTGAAPVSRDVWRNNSGINDVNRELIPMNFFLYSKIGINDDFILVDQLVDTTADPYNQQFAQLALFAFHLANSGNWRNSIWKDGRVAGWANELIRDVAWSNNDWTDGAFLDANLEKFVADRVDGEQVTKHKVFTNYRFMLRSAGVLVGDKLQPNDLRQRWLTDAVQLVWDRQIFDGALSASTKLGSLEEILIDNEIYKLLRCSKEQCRAFARAAYTEFKDGQASERLNQLENLKELGLIAA